MLNAPIITLLRGDFLTSSACLRLSCLPAWIVTAVVESGFRGDVCLGSTEPGVLLRVQDTPINISA